VALLVPMFPATATFDGEVFVTLADPPRVASPGVEPRVLRPGVARYAGQRLACVRLDLPAAELVSPARATVRRVEIEPNAALPGITQMLEVSPLPFGLEPVLQRLRGLPTFYLTPFAAAPADDSLVTMDQNLAAGAASAVVAAVFPDGLAVAPAAWMQLIEDALSAIGDNGLSRWNTARINVFGTARRCRVLDHAGRPLAEDPDPTVSKTFTVRRFQIVDDSLAAARTVTLRADSDLELTLNVPDPGEPGNPITTLMAPAEQYAVVSWAGAPPAGDVSIPMLALYETRAGAVPELALRLPDAVTAPRVMTLQVLDLARWFARLAPGTSPILARYRAGSHVEPLVDGFATFQRLVADLADARGAGNGAQLAAWTLNRFALDPTVSDDDIVDILRDIDESGGIVRVLATKFINLKNPDLATSQTLALLLIFLLSEAAFVAAVAKKPDSHPDRDANPILPFWIAPAAAAAIATAIATRSDFQWLLDEIGESAKSTVDAINEIAPKLAAYAENLMRIADNPLADGMSDPLFGLENDVDQFSVFHNKSQMVKRPPFQQAGRQVAVARQVSR